MCAFPSASPRRRWLCSWWLSEEDEEEEVDEVENGEDGLDVAGDADTSALAAALLLLQQAPVRGPADGDEAEANVVAHVEKEEAPGWERRRAFRARARRRSDGDERGIGSLSCLVDQGI